MTEPRTARAADEPCTLAGYHAPTVVQTHGHHVHPLYLQRRLGVSDDEIIFACPNCHAATHEWLGYLLGESRKPEPEPGRLAKAEAWRSYDWFMDAKGGT